MAEDLLAINDFASIKANLDRIEKEKAAELASRQQAEDQSFEDSPFSPSALDDFGYVG